MLWEQDMDPELGFEDIISYVQDIHVCIRDVGLLGTKNLCTHVVIFGANLCFVPRRDDLCWGRPLSRISLLRVSLYTSYRWCLSWRQRLWRRVFKSSLIFLTAVKHHFMYGCLNTTNCLVPICPRSCCLSLVCFLPITHSNIFFQAKSTLCNFVHFA